VIHNFRGYDSHLICESVSKSKSAHRIEVVAETFERYKTMRVGQLKYIDSFQFMNSSLSKLAENIGAVKCKKTNSYNHLFRIDKNHCMSSPEKYTINMAYFIKKGYTKEQMALLLRKGIFPYEYINSLNRLNEIELPPIHNFHSALGKKVSQNEYEHAQNVWRAFNCKNLGDYHDLYLYTDVLLLSDVWTSFRRTSMQHYELDSSHYISAPALAWNAILKYTGVKIELFTEGNMPMHDFAEAAKCGGITMACR